MTSSQERPVLGGLYHDYACVEGRKMKRRSPTLIKSPLTWPMADAPVVPPAIPVLAAGRHATEDPTCNALDRHPRTESSTFRGSGAGFAGVEKKVLKIGDYSIGGLSELGHGWSHGMWQRVRRHR